MIDVDNKNYRPSEVSSEERFRASPERISHISNEHTVHNRVLHESMNMPDEDNAVAGGHMKTGEAVAKLESSENSTQGSKKKKEETFDKLLSMLDEHIDWLDGEIAKLDLRINELIDRIENMEDVLVAIKNGEPLSEKQKALAAKYLKEDGTYNIRDMQGDLNKEKEDLAIAMEKRGELKNEKKAAIDLAERVRLNPDDPNIQKELSEYSQSIDGRKVWNNAIFEANGFEEKAIYIENLDGPEHEIDLIKERLLADNPEAAVSDVGYGNDFDRFFDSHLRTTSAAKSILGDTDTLSSKNAFNQNASPDAPTIAPDVKPEITLENNNTLTVGSPKSF